MEIPFIFVSGDKQPALKKYIILTGDNVYEEKKL